MNGNQILSPGKVTITALVTIAVLFVLAHAALSNHYKGWCDRVAVPKIEVSVDVQGSRVSWQTRPEASAVFIDGIQMPSSGAIDGTNGEHTLTAKLVQVTGTPFLATLLGFSEQGCEKTGTATTQFWVDLLAPSLTHVNAQLNGGNVVISGSGTDDLSGVGAIQLEGFEPVQIAENFVMEVPITELTRNNLTITLFDRQGNQATFGPFLLPLPAPRWELRNIWGETAGYSLMEPSTPTLGFGANSWIFVDGNGNIIRVKQTSPWLYGLVTANLVLVLVLAGISAARARRLAIKRQFEATHKSAILALRRTGQVGWLNGQPTVAEMRAIILDDIPDALRKIAIAQKAWPHNPLLIQRKKMAEAVGFWFPTFQTVRQLAFDQREYAAAWRLVHQLPLQIPLFLLLRSSIERHWLPLCTDVLMNDHEHLWLLDAMGLKAPSHLLEQLLYCNQRGVSLSAQDKRELRQFHTEFIARAQVVAKEWSPRWRSLLVPRIETVTSFGLEGFSAFLLTVKLGRSNPVGFSHEGGVS